MASGASVTVEGADTFARTLHGAADGLGTLEAASAQTGALVRARAAGRAPVLTGALAGSLTASVDGSSVEIASGLIYAPVIHYGWAARNIAAHPFLVPAAEDSEEIIVGFYERDIQAELNKVRGA